MRPIERLRALGLHHVAMWKAAGRVWPADRPVPREAPPGWTHDTIKSGKRKGQPTLRWTGDGGGHTAAKPEPEDKSQGAKGDSGWTPPAGHPLFEHPSGSFAWASDANSARLGRGESVELTPTLARAGVFATVEHIGRHSTGGRYKRYHVVHLPLGLSLGHFHSPADARLAMQGIAEGTPQYGADAKFGNVRTAAPLPERFRDLREWVREQKRTREKAKDERQDEEVQRLAELNRDPVAVARDSAPKGYHKVASGVGEDGQQHAQLVKTMGAAGQYVIAKKPGRHFHKRRMVERYMVTHGPSGMGVATYSSLKQARAAARHLHQHAPTVGKNLGIGRMPSSRELDALREALSTAPSDD